MQVDPMPQVGNILRALVGDPCDVVLVDEHDRGMMIICRSQFLHIDYGSIRNSAGDFKPGAPFAFNVFRVLGLSPQQRVYAKQHYAAGCYQSIKSKRIHTKRQVEIGPGPPTPLSGYAQSAPGGSGSAVTEVLGAVKISRGALATCHFLGNGSQTGWEGLLFRLAANTLADQVDKTTLGSFAELIVVIRLLANDETPAVIAAIEPFRGGSSQTVAAVEPDPRAHLDKRSALRQLGRLFELYAHQCRSLIVLENPHGANRDFVAGFGLPDRTPVCGSQEQAHCKYGGEHHCSYKKGLFQSLLSRGMPFRPLLCGIGRVLSIRFSDSGRYFGSGSLNKGNLGGSLRRSPKTTRRGCRAWYV